MAELKILKATLDDIDALQAIGKETFFETFAESNTAKDMQNYLDNNFTPSAFRTQLQTTGSQFFIAWDGNQAAGYLKVNSGPAQTEPQGESALEIERIYVRSAYFGKKAGQLLYEKALEVAEIQNKEFIWLGVWEENPRAIRFYEKNGFIAFSKHIFKMGDDEQTDIMMRKKI